MKKFLKNIWKIDIIFTGIYFILSVVLMQFELTFMPFIKIFAKIFIPLGYIISIIYGLVILIRKKKILATIFSIFLVICVGYILFWPIFFWYGFDYVGEVTYYNNEKVILVYSSGFLGSQGWLKFYKWTNPFIRTTKEFKIEAGDSYIYKDGKYWGKEYLKKYYPDVYEENYDDEE